MTLKRCESPSKRHSWTWSGCGHTAGFGVIETVGGELLEGTESPQKSNTIEVLRKNGDSGGHEMIMIMGRTQMERYSPEASIMSNGNIRFDLSGSELLKESRMDEDLPSPDCLTDTLDLVTEDVEQLSLMNNGHLIKSTARTKEKKEGQNKLKNGKTVGNTISSLDVSREILRTVTWMVLLLAEGAAWLTLYSDMKGREKDSILLFLLLPTLINSFAWFAINWYNKQITMKFFCLIALLLFLSIPSPLLV